MNLLNIYQYFLIAYVSIVFLLMFLEGLKAIDFKLDKHWQFNNLLVAMYSFLGLLLKLGIIATPSASVMQFAFVFREVGMIQPSRILSSLFITLLPFLFFIKAIRASRHAALIFSSLLMNSIFSIKKMLLQFSNFINGVANTDWNYGSNHMDFNAAFLVVVFSTICWTAFFFYIDRMQEADDLE